jgi:hypothetical protein
MKCNVESIINIRIPNAVKKQSLKSHLLNLWQKYQYISAACAVITQVEAMFIGLVGSFLANITSNLLIHIRVDDAVGATCVHGMFSQKRGLKQN